MKEGHAKFVRFLADCFERDRAQRARLRRSLGAAPGTDPAVYPLVEPWIPEAAGPFDSRRSARYLLAGLYALHPVNGDRSLAAALAEVSRRRGSKSLELRFVSLLQADPENVGQYLRQAVTLMAGSEIGVDYPRLLGDLIGWMSPRAHDQRDRIRQQWARDYYRTLQAAPSGGSANDESTVN